MKSDWGDWKRVSCHRNQTLYSSGCVACNYQVTMVSAKRLAKIGLFVYLIFIGLSE